MAWAWVNDWVILGHFGLQYSMKRADEVQFSLISCRIALLWSSKKKRPRQRIRARAKLSVWTVQESCRAIWHRLTHTGRVAATKTHGGFHPLTKHTHIYTQQTKYQHSPNASKYILISCQHNLSQKANSKNLFLAHKHAKYTYFYTRRSRAKLHIYSHT